MVAVDGPAAVFLDSRQLPHQPRQRLEDRHPPPIGLRRQGRRQVTQQRGLAGPRIAPHHPAAGDPGELSAVEGQEIAERQRAAREIERRPLLAGEQPFLGPYLELDVHPVEELEVGVLEKRHQVRVVAGDALEPGAEKPALAAGSEALEVGRQGVEPGEEVAVLLVEGVAQSADDPIG